MFEGAHATSLFGCCCWRRRLWRRVTVTETDDRPIQIQKHTHTHRPRQTRRQMHGGRLTLMMDEISRHFCVYTEIWRIHQGPSVIVGPFPTPRAMSPSRWPQSRWQCVWCVHGATLSDLQNTSLNVHICSLYYATRHLTPPPFFRSFSSVQFRSIELTDVKVS